MVIKPREDDDAGAVIRGPAGKGRAHHVTRALARCISRGRSLEPVCPPPPLAPQAARPQHPQSARPDGMAPGTPACGRVPMVPAVDVDEACFARRLRPLASERLRVPGVSGAEMSQQSSCAGKGNHRAHAFLQVLVAANSDAAFVGLGIWPCV